MALDDRAWAYAKTGKADKAIADYSETIRLLDTRGSPTRRASVTSRLFDLSPRMRMGCAAVHTWRKGTATRQSPILPRPSVWIRSVRTATAPAPLRTRRRATRTGRLPITVRRYALGPDSWKAYNNRGEVYLRKGDFDKAIADENTAISLSPELAAPYSNRGQAYLAKGDLDKAIADENESVRLDPRDGEAFDARGLAYQRKGDTSKAEADFARARELGFKRPAGTGGRG